MPFALRALGVLIAAFALVLTGSRSAQGATAVPEIDQPLVPSTAAPGGPAFTLTINGTGFAASATVNWAVFSSGSLTTTPLTPTCNSAGTQCTVSVPASLIASAGTASITVVIPGTPALTSNVAFFEVTNATTAVTLARSDVSTGNGPQSVAAADFNGDGKLDLAVVNGLDNTVSILLGNGDGTFTATSTPPATGASPQWVIAADFNNDGKVDLAVVNNGANTVSILLGNGDGTFQAKKDFATGTGPSCVAAGDFNQDGNLDLAVTNTGANTVSILLGNGDGTFKPKSDLSTGAGSGPSAVAIGDFKHNGLLDLAVADKAGSKVSILFGNGDGTFLAHVDHPANSSPTAIVVADFNRDGNLDLALAAQASNKVLFLAGNGDGSFQSAIPYTTGNGPFDLVAGDFNGDGFLDLAVTNATAGTVSVLLGNGDGTFQPHQDSTTGPTPQGIVAGDFTGVGRLDLASAANGVAFNKVTVLLQAPAVTFVTTALGFGKQAVGTTSASQTTTMTNSGSAALTIQSIVITGTNSGDFSQTNNCIVAPATTGTLAPGSLCAITVMFTPTATGVRSAAVTVTDNAASSPQTVTLTGTGTAPAVTFSQPSINFLSVDLGQTKSASPSVTVTNTGTADLHFTSIAATPSSDYSQTNDCLGPPPTLAPSAVCVIDITFSPSATGTRSGSIAVADDAPGSPQSISLTGIGVVPAVSFAPSGLTFPDQLVNRTSSALTMTLSNTGSGPLLIQNVTASGDFAQTNTCSTSVGGGASCVITVTFTPTAVGPRSGTITVTDNNNGVDGSTQTVNLSGSGVAPTASLSSVSLDFSTVLVGTSSTSQTVTLSDTGTGDLKNVAITSSGDFTQSSNCGSTVAAGASCTITVTFTPTKSGARTGSVTISDNATPSPQTISLTGTGGAPSLTITPSSLTFPSQVAATTSAPQVVTVKNDGNEVDTFTGITVTSTGGAAFAQTSATTCGVTVTQLNPTASCTISVSFTPGGGGSFNGVLTINDTTPSQQQHTVLLSGSGSDFMMSATPNSASATAGSAASYTLTVTPLNGFNQPVTLACNGVPLYASCAFTPSGTVALDGTNPATVTVTVSTIAGSMLVPSVMTGLKPGSWSPHFAWPRGWRPAAPLALWILLLATVGGYASRRRLARAGLLGGLPGSDSTWRTPTGAIHPRRVRLDFSFMALGLLVAASIVLPACAGGAPPTGHIPGTPKGTYAITLTGTSGSLNNKTAVSLTVD